MAAVDAREALRLRLGRGVRFDSPAAPSPELEWARRGTAYFARQLNELSDSELRNPSFVPGWSKAHVVAHVGYHARQMAEAIERTRTGVGLPRSDSAAVHLARV